MNRKNFIAILITAIGILISYTPCFSQDYGNVRIVSESKQILLEKAILKQIADDNFFAKSDIIKTKFLEELKREIKSLTSQSVRDGNIYLSDKSTIEFREENNRLYMKFSLPSNSLNFRVTTPDFIVGSDRINDPMVLMTFRMESEFEIVQNGQLQSIRLLNPLWKVSNTSYSGYELQTSSLSKAHLELLMKYSMPSILETVFLTLNDMNDDLNNYINKAVKNNPALLKELEIDENEAVTASADPLDNSTLLFKHNYSQKGMVKRNATTDASVVTEDVKSKPLPPGTTPSPVDINKKPNTPTPGPIVNKPGGTSTKPKDIDKKPNSTSPGSKINKPPVRNK